MELVIAATKTEDRRRRNPRQPPHARRNRPL